MDTFFQFLYDQKKLWLYYHWYRIKVSIVWGYYSPTRFQTRGPEMQKLVFLFLCKWRVYCYRNRILIGVKSIYKRLLPKQHIKYKTKKLLNTMKLHIHMYMFAMHASLTTFNVCLRDIETLTNKNEYCF